MTSTGSDDTDPPQLRGCLADVYFTGSAMFSLGCLALAFPDLAVRLPDPVQPILVFLHVPLLMVAGLLDSRRSHAEASSPLPLWMRIRGPARAAFTFAFTFLSVVLIQRWNLEIGPIDPHPPEGWGLGSRVLFFAMFSVGMSFANFLAATGSLVPILRGIHRPIVGWSVWISLLVSAIVGAMLGSIVLCVMVVDPISDALEVVRSTLDSSSWIVPLLLVVSIVVPQILPRRR